MRHGSVFGRVVASAAVFAVLGAGAVVAQDSRTFGPDTTSVGVFTGQGTTLPGLTCDTPPAPAARTCTGFLASSVDGTLLDVTVRVPQSAPPHPLVVYVHGWGGSKSSGGEYEDRLIAAGYTYLRYSTRGFGKSWGQTNFGDVNVEIEDLRSMIAQVVDNDDVGTDGTAVAVMGASYGGAHSWLAAVKPVFKTPGQRDVEIRTIIPVAAGSDLLYSLIPNGRPLAATTPAGAVKLSYLNGLFVGGFRPPSQARPYSNYPLYLFRWGAVVNLTEPDYRLPPWRPIVDGIQGYRSVYWQSEFWKTQKTGHLPIFQIQGFTDDLFPVHESLRMLDALKSIDASYPIATYFGDIGHPRAANKVGEVSYLIDLILEWLAMTLKGTPPPAPWPDVRVAITRPYDVAFNRDDVIDVTIGPDDDIMAGRFLGLAPGQASHEFTEPKVITFNPTNTGGVPWDPLVLAGAQELKPNPPPLPSDEVPGDVAVYEVPVATLITNGAPLTVAGHPIVTITGFTPAYRVQLNVRLFDVAGGTKRLVTRGTSTIDSGTLGIPIGAIEIPLVTYGNVWELPATSTLRLEITNVDSPYITPSRVPSVTAIQKVRIEIPTRAQGPIASMRP
jgi:pimeloyl-ACP methyl ester carboxylesterase